MSTQRAAELLARLRAADPLEREVLLSTLADVDPRLRSTFERLLANDGAPPPVGAGGALTDGPGLALLFELGALPVGVGDRVGTVELVGILGEGGMGTVFEGFDARLERRVAVKVLRADHRAGEVARARFRREARILSRLDHAGICQVYDLVERPDADYLILELVEGDTLRAQLRGELAPTHRLEIARALAEALAAAHAKGVVHRDLKPDNVMVRPDGAVKILDFGIARVAATEPDTGAPAAADPPLDATADTSGAPPADPARTTLRTRLGSILGTVAYMSPEQARGEEVTAASDVYSLGLIFQELFGGPPPHPSLSLEQTLERARRGEVEAAEGLDSELAALVERMQALEPRARPSAAEIVAAVRRVEGRPQRRRQRVAAAILVALAAGATTVAVVRARGEGARRCARAAAPLEAIWNQNGRASLAAAFATTGDPASSRIGAAATRGLDAWAASWADARRDACAATHVRGEQSGELLDLRMACLDRALARFRALLGRLSAGDGAPTGQAIQAIGALPPVALCADRELLTAPVALPTDPRARDRIVALEQEIAAGFADVDAGRVQESARGARALVEHAAEIGHPPTETRARYLLGHALRLQGEFAAARIELRAAAAAALAGNEREWLARALTELAFLDGSDLEDLEAAAIWEQMGRGALGSLAPDSILVADFEHALGTARLDAAHRDEARAHLERAERIRRRVLGEEHPDLVRSWVNLSSAEYLAGRFAEAERWAERAAALAERLFAAPHPFTAAAYGMVGSARHQQGDLEGARIAMTAESEIALATAGQQSFAWARSQINVALLEIDLGDPAAALDRLAAPAAIFDRQLPAEHPFRKYPAYATGRALTALGRPSEAIDPLERALGWARAGTDAASELPEIELALAEALTAAGQDPRRARRLVESASAGLATMPGHAELRARAERWLAAHGGSTPAG